MATLRRFEDIGAWKRARELVREVYRVARRRDFSKDLALRGQIRRPAISMSSNIAQRYERESQKAFWYFLSIAKGSAGEVRSQLYVALNEDYLDRGPFDRLYESAMNPLRQISGLIKYLRSRTQASE